MYCPDCGYLNRPDAKFCAACQTPLGVALAGWSGPLQPDDIMDNGRYRIIRPLGKGGMGAVYLAENLQAFGREVVIKEMLDYFDPTDPEQVERARTRFEDEARTLAALKHPAVPDIYGYFSQGGRNYLVMEFIVGESLETGVTHRDGDGNLVPALPYTQEQIIRFGVQLCDLLDYLAGRSDPDSGAGQPVIHHDIKPANVIRDPEIDQVWLVDFGTAKTRFEAGQQPTAEQESIYGTVGYAPPEQYQGESAPRSDVYALAATLYHLFTNDDPRENPFQFERLEKLPLKLRLALRNALAQDIALRSSAAEFKAALASSQPDRLAVGSQPLAYPDAKSAQKVGDVTQLAQQYWDYSRDILYSGDLEHWLRRSMHNPVVAETARRVTTATLDQDAGLDSFLRELDPNFPGGRLQLAQKTVDLGTVVLTRPVSATVELNNNGRGFSHGSVSSSAGWLRESDGRFSVKPGGSEQLVIEADTGQLGPGKRYQETLTLTPADGSKPLKIKVRLAVAKPRVSYSPEQLVFDLGEGEVGLQELNLTNTGGDKAECALTRSEQWLLVQPRKLSIPAGQGAKATVTIRPDRLPPTARPRTQLTLTPSFGPAAAIPVMVIRRRRPSRLWIGLLAALLLALAGWGALQLMSNGRLSAIIPLATPTLLPTAEDLDQEMALVDNYKIDRYEVTNLQYLRYDPAHPFQEGEEMLPVVNITWEGAKGYCQWAGKRLPTKAEWELAAGGGEGWTYPWGNEADDTRLNSADSRQTTGLVPVGSFPAGATPSGVYDLLGNASEWVIGPSEHPQTHQGGSWQDSGLTNSRDFWGSPGFSAATVGFRCIQN